MRSEDVLASSEVRATVELDLSCLKVALWHATILVDRQGLVLDWNDAATRMFGWSAADIVGHDYAMLFTTVDREEGVPRAELSRAQHEACCDDSRWMMRKDGSQFWASGTMLLASHGDTRSFLKLVRNRMDDKIAEQALSRSEAQYRLITDTIPQLIWRSRSDGCWDWAGPQWTLFTGQSQADSLGHGWLEMVHPDDRERTEQAWRAATRAGEEFEVEHRLHRADGGYCWFQTRAVPFREVVNRRSILHWFGASTDIDAVRQARQHIVFLAHHDALTGSANRVLLEQTLAREASDDRGRRLGVLCFDLDHFKRCNDRVGHRGGDVVLREVSSRLTVMLSPHDLLARIGGDEFVMLRLGDDEEALETLAGRIVGALSVPIHVEGQQLHLSASVGWAVCPTDGRDADELLRRADVALYRAKREGGNRACRYEVTMDEAARDRRLLVGDLEQAIAGNGLHIHYQPFFAIRDRALLGFEALARWSHPTRGSIPPDVFIPLAEGAGLIEALGSWVLAEACAVARSWPGDHAIAVNLSPAQLRDDRLERQLADVLARTGLAPERLELEVTESVLMQDGELMLERLMAIKRLGVRIALDDFGTGYSSLSYLRRFPFDKVKIDQSFVRGMTDNATSRAIVSAIISLGHSLDLTIAAEGVETEAQLALLAHEGCDEVQGFLLGMPAAASAVPAGLEAKQ